MQVLTLETQLQLLKGHLIPGGFQDTKQNHEAVGSENEIGKKSMGLS